MLLSIHSPLAPSLPSCSHRLPYPLSNQNPDLTNPPIPSFPLAPMINRERLLGSILSLVKQFVYKASLSKGLSEQASREAGGKIFTFGSYRFVPLSFLLLDYSGRTRPKKEETRTDGLAPLEGWASMDRERILICCASCPSI